MALAGRKSSGRTRRSGNAAEMSGDGEDDGEQHPQGGGAEAGPRDRPPGLERRHGTAAVARPETNAIGGAASLNRSRHSGETWEEEEEKENSMKVICSE